MARTASLQKADDPATKLVHRFLGTDLGRFPFDARFSAWGLAITLSCALFMLYWIAIPFPVIAVTVAWFGSRFLSQYVGLRWWIFGLIMFFVLVTVPGLLISFLAMPWFLALPAGFGTGIWITRRVMRHVDTNRPIRYWRWVLTTISDGPRPHRDPLGFTPFDPAEPEPIDLRPLQIAGLAYTKGTPVAQFRDRTIFEADRWLPENEERAAATQAWLQEWGLNFHVNDGGTLTIFDPLSLIEVNVQPGHHAYFEAGNNGKPSTAVRTLPHALFRDQYERVDGDVEPEEPGDDIINVGDHIKVGHMLGVEPPYNMAQVEAIDSPAEGEYVISARKLEGWPGEDEHADVHNPPPPPA